MVTGGPAVTDGLVGDLPEDIDPTDPDRVASDTSVLRAFLDAHRPTLGICYGMQLASALRGGTIYADVQRQFEGATVHSSGRGGTMHTVSVSDGTRFRDIVGADQLVVNTRHVQAVAEPGTGMTVAARADDGVIEALESTDGSFVGVQFHPEAMDPPLDAVFTDLVERARQKRP